MMLLISTAGVLEIINFFLELENYFYQSVDR